MARPRSRAKLCSSDGTFVCWIGRNIATVLLRGDAVRLSEDRMSLIVRKGLTMADAKTLVKDVRREKRQHPGLLHCRVCGFNRAIEQAHIIPDRVGGPREEWNLLPLCPNCHTLFDTGRLQPGELRHLAPSIVIAIQRGLQDHNLSEWCKTACATFKLEVDSVTT